MDYATLTGSVDFSGVLTAGAAVGAAVIGVYVAIKGYQLVKSFVTK
ncbi:MAG: hypothetical protein IBX50_14485 [Marinospirillum sp.]|nr:major capsid protein [Marinospirillum sp.]MBE0507896.1 hypothetical protein [Marinospirillum sp.]